MADTAERLQELYGPERNVRTQKIRNKLTKSHVLQDGEYNFTNRALGKNIYNTSHSTDFSVSFSFTVLPAKSDSDVMFCLQSYQGLRIDRSIVY